MPPWHMPPVHAIPSGFAGSEHMPVIASHVPVSWHSLLAEQTVEFAPVHTPLWHVSVCVQALPSSHAGPVRSLQVPSTSAPAAIEHASHTPAEQALPQQTPSTQNWLAHSVPDAHGVPLSKLDRT